MSALNKILSFFVVAVAFLPLAHSKVIESVVAIVNDSIITKTDIDRYREKLKKGSITDDLLISQGEIPAVAADNKKLVDLMINERILDSEVKKQGLQVTFEKVEREIDSIASKNNITKEQLKQALAGEGVRFSDYQDFVKTRLERQELIGRSITSKIKISDEEISAYYANQSGKQNEKIFEYKVAHILFKTDKGDEAAFEKARSVLLRLNGGSSSFEKLAAQYSEDPAFNDGGLLGTFKAGELVGEIDRTVQRLEIGETSKIIQTKSGYHIVKLVDKKTVADPSWVKEQNRIRAILYQEAFKKQFQFWLDQKRQEAFIRINKG